MFKHGFVDKRSLPQRWDLEHMESIRETRPPLSDEGQSNERKGEVKLKSGIEYGSEETTEQGKNLPQASTCSQDSGWTLNTDLDRVSSSLASWDEDEFEKETSRRVETLLQELDAALYEGASLSNKQLQQECAEWAAKFPYLRVVGKQTVAPKREKGYSYHASSHQSTRKPRTAASATTRELALIGRRLKPTSIRYSDDEQMKTTAVEEVLVQDGIYEELLAVDRSAEDEETYTNRGASGSTLRPEPLDDSVKTEIVDALFEEVWPDVERTLYIPKDSARNGSVTVTDKNYFAMGQDLPPTSLNKSRSHILPASKNRVPSTAVGAYGRPLGFLHNKPSSTVSRTAPAVFRGRPPSSNIRDGGSGAFLRNSRFTKLPPIEGLLPTAPLLPNVPGLKSQTSRATDPMARVSEDPLDADEEEDVVDTTKRFAAMPPLDTKIVKPSQYQRDITGPDAIARNMQALKISKRQPIDAKSHNKFGRNANTASDGRKAKPLGIGGHSSSLVIQGYQQRGFPK